MILRSFNDATLTAGDYYGEKVRIWKKVVLINFKVLYVKLKIATESLR